MRRRPGYHAEYAKGRLILGEMLDALEAAGRCLDYGAATDQLIDAEYHRRRFAKWLEAAPGPNDGLRTQHYLMG